MPRSMPSSRREARKEKVAFTFVGLQGRQDRACVAERPHGRNHRGLRRQFISATTMRTEYRRRRYQDGARRDRRLDLRARRSRPRSQLDAGRNLRRSSLAACEAPARRPCRSRGAGLLVLAFAVGWIWWLSQQVTGGPLRLSRCRLRRAAGLERQRPRAALAAFHRSCGTIKNSPPGHAMGGRCGDCGRLGRCLQARTGRRDPQCRAALVRNGVHTLRRRRRRRHRRPVHRLLRAGDLAAAAPATAHTRRRSMACPTIWSMSISGLFRDKLKGEHISGRLDGHRLVPYATRADIDAHGLAHAPSAVLCGRSRGVVLPAHPGLRAG